jgi:hypothetical protein
VHKRKRNADKPSLTDEDNVKIISPGPPKRKKALKPPPYKHVKANVYYPIRKPKNLNQVLIIAFATSPLGPVVTAASIVPLILSEYSKNYVDLPSWRADWGAYWNNSSVRPLFFNIF